MPAEAHALWGRRFWLFSRRADFWLASGGASAALLVSVLVILWRGDRELDALDFVLSEFHLGATYYVVMRRRLWRHRSVDVLLVPLVILAITYTFSIRGETILLTSIAMYAAVWHRGRQSLGVARFYQRQVGGPVSQAHRLLFRGAIYLPMLAATLAYIHIAPMEYEEKPYLALTLGAEMTSIAGVAAAAWVIAYLSWALWQIHGQRIGRLLLKEGSECFDKLSMNGKYTIISNCPFAASTNSGQALGLSKDERRVLEQPASENQRSRLWVHPGEWWVVLAHAVAFGSGYVLGAANASFLLVLAVHHEVQYLYFTFAMTRRPENFRAVSQPGIETAAKDIDSRTCEGRRGLRTELKHAASFAVWPIIGFVGAIVGGWSELEWLAPLGMGGLFCHYWLDGRIWTRRGRAATEM
jgi:hypothetical protein